MTGPGNPPQIITRTLTVPFVQAVTTGGLPQIVQVVVSPLSNAATSTADALVVGGAQQATVELSGVNPRAVFALVPSNWPGLSAPINYRVSWRAGVLERTYSYDFAMPDFNVSFADLADLGAIVDGQAYVQQTDLGVPGGVARLDALGNVLDGTGNAISGAVAADVTALRAELAGYARLTNGLLTLSQLPAIPLDYVDGLSATLGGYAPLIEGVVPLHAIPAGIPVDSISGLTVALANTATLVNGTLASEQVPTDIPLTSIWGLTAALSTKADLSGGAVPAAQLPPGAITRGVAVQTFSDLLALSAPQASPGNVVVVATGASAGTYLMTGSVASQPSSWILISPVASVNGRTGPVTLGAADVGAVSSVNGLTGAVTLTPADIGALATNAVIEQSQVVGLTAALAGAATLTNGVLTASQLPSLHTSLLTDWSTATSGFVTTTQLAPVITQQNTDKTAIAALSAQQATNTTAISSLESKVGDGFGPAASVEWVTETRLTGATPADFYSPSPGSGVTVDSPWGIDITGAVTGTSGLYYNQPGGAAAGETLWPYVTPNGHLELRQWDESAPTDSPPVTQADLAPVSALASAAATQTALAATNAELAAQAGTLTGKADLDSITGRLKSSQLPLLTTGNLADWDQTAANFAQLSGGVLLSSQVPPIPISAVIDLTTMLMTRAELNSAGVLTASQIPPLAISNTTGLTAALAAKADLVGGTLNPIQLPPLTTADLTDFTTVMNGYAALSSGFIPASLLPPGAVSTGQSTTSLAQMYALTGVGPGDIVTVQSGDPATSGTFLLNALPSSTAANWFQIASGDSAIVGPGDIGAVAYMTPGSSTVPTYGYIQPAQVQGIDFSSYVTVAALQQTVDSAVAAAPPLVYQAVDWAIPAAQVSATTGLPTLGGVAITAGNRVLVFSPPGGQPAPQTGIWTATGANTPWIRDPAMQSSAMAGALIPSKPQGLAGYGYSESLWQVAVTVSSGLSDTGVSLTQIGWLSPAYVPALGPGTSGLIYGTDGTLSVLTPADSGLTIGAGGLTVSPSVPRGVSIPLLGATVTQLTDPHGITFYGIEVAHGLGTENLIVQVYDISGGAPELVLTGVSTTSTTVTVSFANSPAPQNYVLNAIALQAAT